MESDKSKPAIDLLSKMYEYYDLDLYELLAQKGFVFHQKNQQDGENGIIRHYHTSDKLIEQLEKRLEEKDNIIRLLEEKLEQLDK